VGDAVVGGELARRLPGEAGDPDLRQLCLWPRSIDGPGSCDEARSALVEMHGPKYPDAKRHGKVVWEVARKTIIVSDLTGKEIEAREAAKVTITYADARRGQVVLDVNADEVEELASKGTRQARRGRRPKAVS